MELTQRLLLALLSIGLGTLSFIFLFRTDRFREWAADHLDRNKTTEGDMFDISPRGTMIEPSQAPNWYYRIIGSVALAMAVLLAIVTVFGRS